MQFGTLTSLQHFHFLANERASHSICFCVFRFCLILLPFYFIAHTKKLNHKSEAFMNQHSSNLYGVSSDFKRKFTFVAVTKKLSSLFAGFSRIFTTFHVMKTVRWCDKTLYYTSKLCIIVYIVHTVHCILQTTCTKQANKLRNDENLILKRNHYQKWNKCYETK